jgi:hypothetical protein
MTVHIEDRPQTIDLTDYAARLRLTAEIAPSSSNGFTQLNDAARELLRESADEIEYLGDLLALNRDQGFNRLHADNYRLRSEVERLTRENRELALGIKERDRTKCGPDCYADSEDPNCLLEGQFTERLQAAESRLQQMTTERDRWMQSAEDWHELALKSGRSLQQMTKALEDFRANALRIEREANACQSVGASIDAKARIRAADELMAVLRAALSTQGSDNG